MDNSVRVISSKESLFDLRLREVIKYRGLITLLVRRNYATRYKQTILGSAWLIINPVCTVVMNTFIFGTVAGLSTDGIPKPLFYLMGNIVWSVFAECLSCTSNTFVNNSGLFGKVYFPRLCTPISDAITQVGDFFIKFILLVLLSLSYALVNDYQFEYHSHMLIIPILVIQLALTGIGCGIIISSLTTKYRDLQVLVGFGVSIWMYLTPIVYSIDVIPTQFLSIYLMNPISPIILMFRYAWFGVGFVPWFHWGISWIFTIVVMFSGVVIFNHVERTFMDTV